VAEKRISKTVRLPADLWDSLAEEAKTTERSQNYVITQALKAHVGKVVSQCNQPDTTVVSPRCSHDPSPACAGTDSGKEKEKNTEKKKKAPRLAPLDVSERVFSLLNELSGSNFQFNAAGHRKKLQHALDLAPEAKVVAMIHRKVAQWKGTKIAHCLRPKTLFGPSCQEYLEEAPTSPGTSQQSLPSTSAQLGMGDDDGYTDGTW